MKRLLAILTVLALLLTMVPMVSMPTAEATTYKTATVKGGWLRLRSAPSFDGAVLGSYYTGTVVTILGTAGSWYHVQTASGLTGYMYGAYLTVKSTPSGGTAYVTSTNGLGVRLRTGPGTAYSVIGVYSVGTSVTVLSAGTNWSYIQIGSQTGYMMSRFLTTVAPSPDPDPGYGYTAYVTSTNGYGVRLRGGPGTNYSITGFYAVGTEVWVLTYGATWCYIRVNGRTGYMMTKFLTTTGPSPSVVTAVSLSDYYPVTGETLTATIAPTGATVSYQWENEYGAVISYATTLPVTGDLLGHSIRLTVTGYGSWTGTVSSSYTAAVTSGSESYVLSDVIISDTTPEVGETLTAEILPVGATANVTWYRDTGISVGTGSSYTPGTADVGHGLYCVAVGTGNTSGTVSSYTTDSVVNGTSALSGTVILPTSAMAGHVLTANLSLNTTEVNCVWYMGSSIVGSGTTFKPSASMVGEAVYVVATAISGSGYEGSISSNNCYITSTKEATSTDME